MESNFAYNYLDTINELQEVLLQPYIDQCESQMQFDIVETEHSLDKVYFIDDAESPCCKVSFTDKGVTFYEKSIQD